MKREFTIIAIHGEGDRDTVNELQVHRNQMDAEEYTRKHLDVPEHLIADPDEYPDILVVLRDEAHAFRIEWPVLDWDEVEQWKKLAGYDEAKRHWKHGARVKVEIGG